MSTIPPGSNPAIQPADIDQVSLFPPLDPQSSQRIAQLARMHLRDYPMPFMSRVMCNGVSFRFELPVANIEPNTFSAVLTDGTAPHTTTLVAGTDFTLDQRQGVMLMTQVPANQIALVCTGQYLKSLLPGEMNVYVQTAVLQHTYGADPQSTLDVFPVQQPPVSTTITAASNGLNLPQATINVVSTAGLLTAGTALVQTASPGMQTVTYTGLTLTSLTGCTGGAGAMSTGGTVVASYGTAPTIRLNSIEEYPLSFLAASMALWDLATEASMEVDIRTPDGVSIPRSQLFQQIMQAIAAVEGKYREMCSIFNIGVYRIQAYDLRRVSRTTNRYVPIYRSREYDDLTFAQRELPPRDTYPRVVTDLGTYDPTRPYVADNVVFKGGLRYIALQPVPVGKLPDVDVNPATGSGFYWKYTTIGLNNWMGTW